MSAIRANSSTSVIFSQIGKTWFNHSMPVMLRDSTTPSVVSIAQHTEIPNMPLSHLSLLSSLIIITNASIRSVITANNANQSSVGRCVFNSQMTAANRILSRALNNMLN